MSTEYEYYMKEDTFHNSHTGRHPVCPVGKETSLSIQRPEHKDSRVTTKYYSEFDEYLIEKGTSTEPVTTGVDQDGKIPLKLSQSEVIAKLEEHCVSKTRKYDSRSNTSSVTYCVPSTYEVSVRDAKDSNFSRKVNPTYSMINGRLYDRDYIYERNAWTASDFRAVCPVKIAQPLLKNASNTVDKKIVPLSISSLSSHLHELNYYRGSWYGNYDGSYAPKPHHGILKHDTPWSYDSGRQVVNDLFVDLGSPQLVTHIGTVGSYPPTAVYLALANNERRMKSHPDAHKYNRTILTVNDPCQEQSWPVSYRLFYKNAISEEYHPLGNYRANCNSHGLVVNDISGELAGLKVRYLMLKIVSNRPYTFRSKYNHPVKMSIAVYGRETSAPKPKIMADAVSGAPAMINYTLSVPAVSAGKKHVEVKQNKSNGGGSKTGSGNGNKHMGKRNIRQDVDEAVWEARTSPVGYIDYDVAEGESTCEENELYECGDDDVLFDMPAVDASFWDPVIPYTVDAMNEDQWPALVAAAAAAAAAAAPVKPVAVKSVASTDNEAAMINGIEAKVNTNGVATFSIATTATVEDNQGTSSAEAVVEIESPHDETISDGTDSVSSDEDWMLV